MAKRQLGLVLHYLRGILVPRAAGDLSDGQLLEKFVNGREESCFAALVKRHGGLVLGVCRRTLGDEQDAEDAFQATFLVLAQKAPSIGKRESVGSWLYGVAQRVSSRLKAGAARRGAKEALTVPVRPGDPVAEIAWRELRPILDEEMDRLPEVYRAPLVLCYLENRTVVETARALGWPRGTVSGRLARGRELLRKRLTRRGLTLSAGLLAGALYETTAAAIPAALEVCTVKAAALVAAGQPATPGLISSAVASLVEGVLHAMWLTKIKIATSVLAAFAVLGSGAALFTYRAHAEKPMGISNPGAVPPAPRVNLPPAAPKKDAKERQDEIAHLKREIDLLKAEMAVLKAQMKILQAEKQGGRKLGNEEKKPVPALELPGIQAVSPDKRSRAEAKGMAVTLLDLATQKLLWQSITANKPLTSLAFSPDGKFLASGSKDGSTQVMEAANGKLLQVFRGHRAAVRSVGFTPDGKTLISIAADKATVTWDLATGKEISRQGAK